MTSINEETTDEQTNPFKSTNEDHTKNDNFKSNNPFDEEPNPAEEQQHESEPRNNQYNVQRTPKPPKRRTSKSIKYMLKRAPSTSLLRNRSYSQSTEKEDKEIEEDTSKSNLSSTKYKGSTSNPIDLISANKTSPSPAKRPVFQRSKTLSTIKRLPLEKKGKKSKRTAISPTTPCADSPTELTQATVQNNNLDYSDVIALMRKSPLHKPVGNLPIPKMSIEYGKADIDTREYVHDMIIHEIENGFFLGPVLRAVYEGNDHEKFLERLDCRIKQHDRDIERMCNFHYQGFIESITELINVRSDAEKLKNQTLVINKDLQESGKEVARKSDDLIQCQLQQCNVASAIEKLTLCLPVLQMYTKMSEQMKSGRYYSALKTLEQLEHTYLPRIYSYRFCEIMLENIPKIREEIKEVSMSELKDFLENVRKNCDKIGMVAMKQVEKERNLEQSAVSTLEINDLEAEENPVVTDVGVIRKRTTKNTSNVKKAAPKPPSVSPQHHPRINPFNDDTDEEDNFVNNTNPFDEPDSFTHNKHGATLVENGNSNPFEEATEVVTDLTEVNPFLINHGDKEPQTKTTDEPDALQNDINYEDLSASDLVDFSPVYKCLHIFGLVGSRAQFETYYRTQRRNQARLVLQPPATMQDNPESYANFFHQIVGFFVVEDHVLHTAPSLISRQFIDDLWEIALSKLVALLRTDSGYASDAIVMMKVKNLIVIFADTLKAYGFPVTRLFGLLMEMRDQYGEMLLKQWSQKFNDIFNEDNYTPMQIESDAESQALLSTYPYEDPNFEQSVYPRKLPFSRFVPRIYNEIKNFILACLKYCEDLHLSSTEVDDMIRKSTNLLLTRTLATGLQTLVQKPSLGLTELVQIIVNTTHLENSCKHVEKYVHQITGVRAGSAHSAKLVGVSTFKDARSQTESQIYTKLNSKIDEFFELAEYVWDMKEPQGRASRYLGDLIEYLQTNFKVFTNLPSNVAQTACMSACRHISARLMELVMDPDIKSITMATLQQFNLDVMQCELFSNSEPVPGFQDGALQMSFIELRQLLDLFLSWDWSSYLADYGSGSSKYLRVNPGTALTLLEKIKEERGHRNIFASLSKQEREKKKLLETVVRQLRGIVNDWTMLCVPHQKLSKHKRSQLLRL